MTERQSYEVAGLGEDGDGVIDLAGGLTQPAYIPGALPGDLVHRREGGGWRIEQGPNAQRRKQPLCPHFPHCGGCSVQHMSDDLYEHWKATKLSNALVRHGVVEQDANDDLIEPMVRAPLHSRRRAVLTARRADGAMTLGFHEARSHDLVDLSACAILTAAIMAALAPLRQIAAALWQDGDCRLTVLDVGSGLDVAVETGRRRSHAKQLGLLTRLAGEGQVLRLTVDGELVLMRARPLLAVAGVTVEPPPGAFVQAVAEAEAAMTAIAADAIRESRAKRVADLYAGLGAFALAAARHARVLAVDSNRPAIEALAAAARRASGLKPIETKVRDLARDPLSPRELAQLDAVVLDPPRAGAKAQVEALAASTVKCVVAVSCNPATLARDLAILTAGGYRLERAVPVDQFLFTAHLEAVAVLRR